MRQCRRGLSAQSLPRIDQDESKEPWFVNAKTKSATKERLPRGRTCEFTRTGRNTMWGRQNVAFTPTKRHKRHRRLGTSSKSTQRSDETTRVKQHTKRLDTKQGESLSQLASESMRGARQCQAMLRVWVWHAHGCGRLMAGAIGQVAGHLLAHHNWRLGGVAMGERDR